VLAPLEKVHMGSLKENALGATGSPFQSNQTLKRWPRRGRFGLGRRTQRHQNTRRDITEGASKNEILQKGNKRKRSAIRHRGNEKK